MSKHQIPHWHRAVHAVHFGFVSGLIVVTFLGSLAATVLSPLWVQPADAATGSFYGGGFWTSQVPGYTTLHADSAGLAASVAQQVSQYGAAFTKDSGSPVYIAEPGTPTVTVVPWDCGGGITPGLADQWLAVPIPFYAVPGPGPKPQMVVQQSGTVWEFGHMRNVSGQWQACTGGQITTNTEGSFPAPYGVSASGLATLAGQLSIEDLRSGNIDHAIGLSLPQTNGAVWPATQSAGAHANAPPMGLRLRLDPTVNVSNLGLSAAGQAIARAAQTYGFVVWNSSASVGIIGENPVSATSRGLADPYNAILAPGGTNSVLQNFPWDRLQALPTNYGQASLPAITQFNVSPSTIAEGGRVTLSWQSTNVNRCAIAGVGDNLPANASSQSQILTFNTTFVLRCAGPAGSASSQVSVAVSRIGANDGPRELPAAIVIDHAYSGYANILPELMSADAAQTVYKVVYYESSVYLSETAVPPFALNTGRMNDGQHKVEARIYHRDGRIEQKVAGIYVNNGPETLFAAVQSSPIKAPSSISLLWGLMGVAISASFMAGGSWWGWHRAHLLH